MKRDIEKLAVLTFVLFLSAVVVLTYLTIPAVGVDPETGRLAVDLLRVAVPVAALVVFAVFCFMLGRFHENPDSL